jgi:hypothetical protein
MEQYHNKITSVLKKKLPVKYKPVQYLMDVLGISLESAYRRMRGQIPFTLDEVILLSHSLHFSIDQVIGEADARGGAYFQIDTQIESFGEETIFKFLQRFADGLQLLVDAQHSETYVVINRFPLFCLPFETLWEFDYCRILYSRDKISVKQTFKDILISDKLKEQYEKVTLLQEQLPNVSIVLDKNIFQKTLNEIIYFYSIHFLTKKDVEVLHKGMLELLEYYTLLATTGKNRFGKAYKIYLSDFAIDANCAHCTADKTEISQIWLYPEQRIQIFDNRTVSELHKNWVQSQMKFSSLITSSNDVLQRDFFSKTYHLVNSLLDILKK